jgi:hypothetical protein
VRLVDSEHVDAVIRHGHASAEQHLTATGFADALLSCAASLGVDLMVMGGYGHSRVRERVLGGVTRETLARMNGPWCSTGRGPWAQVLRERRQDNAPGTLPPHFDPGAGAGHAIREGPFLALFEAVGAVAG